MGDTSDLEECITYGPWGSRERGNGWVYKPKGFIKSITIDYGEDVDRIQFQSNGESPSSEFGQIGGKWTHSICIDYPKEYLVSISGTYGHGASDLVNSICFKTNKNVYGPFGTNSGNVFSHHVEGEVIVGFHGRSGSYIHAIGVYAKPKSFPSDPNSTYIGKIMSKSLSRMSSLTIMPRDAGPWGAGGGKPWDDGVFSAIKQVHVHIGELNVIYALQFKYMKNDGTYVMSQIHGGTDGSKIESVDLDGEEEFLTGVSGFFRPVEGCNGLEAIVSISFHTNKKIHGPYGEEKGVGNVCFCSTAFPGKVVGFHGRNNGFLNAVGVHMEYF